MKAIYLLFCLLSAILFSEITHAQTSYEYSYDASGNRTRRAIIVLKKASINPDSLTLQQAFKPFDELVGIQKARIYPNPTKGIIQVELPDLNDQSAIILIYDSNGKMIIQKSAISSINEIDLTSNPSGIYIMITLIGQDKKEWKIIKE